jgi:hypothetical protein
MFTAPDRLQQQFAHIKNAEEQQTLDWSIVPRILWGLARTRLIVNGATVLTASHFAPAAILQACAKLFHATRMPGSVCRVWSFYFYTSKDENLMRRAVYLRFEPADLQRDDSLLLEHFLERGADGRPRTITSLLDIQDGLRGVELFLEFLLDWRNVMEDVYRDFRDGYFDGFSIAFVLREFYDALTFITDMVANVTSVAEAQPQEYLDSLVGRLLEVKDHMTLENFWRYNALTSSQTGHAHVAHPVLPLPSQSPSLLAPVAALESRRMAAESAAASQSRSTRSGSSETASRTPNVCFKDLGVVYGVVGATVCHGDCGFVHYDDLPRRVNGRALSALVSAHMKDSAPGKDQILAGIAADKDLK